MTAQEKKLALLTADSKVTIFVGPDEQKFHLPKDLVCHYSSFFTKAFEGDFKEAIDGVCRLPKDEPALFSIVAVWFYETNFDLESPDDDSEFNKAEAYFHLRLRTYYLADKLGIDLLCEQLIPWLEHYWDGMTKSFTVGNLMEYEIIPSIMQEICDKTTLNSPLRRMVLRHIATFLFTSDRPDKEIEARELYGFRNEIYQSYIKEVPGLAAELVDVILNYHSPSRALNHVVLGKRKRPERVGRAPR